LQEECNEDNSIEVVSPRKGRKRAPVENADEEPARKTRRKAGTVSPLFSHSLEEPVRNSRRKVAPTSFHPIISLIFFKYLQFTILNSRNPPIRTSKRYRLNL